MALILYLTWHRSRSPFGIAAHPDRRRDRGACRVLDLRHLADEAQAVGLDLSAAAADPFMLPWSVGEISRYPWYALPDLLGNLVAVIFVTASSTLFNTTGIEVAAHREANLERELNVTGLANMLSGALGGLYRLHFGQPYRAQPQRRWHRPAFRPDGRRDFGADAGRRSRLLGYMPKFVLGGLLIYLGADQCTDGSSSRGARLSMTEYLSLLAIIVIIVQWGFIAGVLIGIVIGCATFALSASRIEFDQVQFRRLRIPQLAGPLARRPGGALGAWRQDPGPEPAELSVLRLGQPALPACQGAVGSAIRSAAIWCSTSSWSPASIHRRPTVLPRSSAPPHDRGIRLVLVTCRRRRRRRCARASSSRMRSSSSRNSITRWNGARTRSSGSIRARRKRPPCATGSPRSSATKTTPTN